MDTENENSSEKDRRRSEWLIPLITVLVFILSVRLLSALGTVRLLPQRIEASGVSALEADYEPWPSDLAEQIVLDLPSLATAVAVDNIIAKEGGGSLPSVSGPRAIAEATTTSGTDTESTSNEEGDEDNQGVVNFPTLPPKATSSNTPAPARTSTPTPTATNTPVPGLPTAEITTPTSGAGYTGAVSIIGTASGTDFSYFTLEYGFGTNPGGWATVTGATSTPVTKGALGVMNVSSFANGAVTVRLLVFNTAGDSSEARVTFNVTHPPTATPVVATATPPPTPTDTPVPVSVQFSAASYSLAEDGGSATITVNLGAASTGTVTVNYATSNGSATAGYDYTATSGVLTFTTGQVSRTFNVPITNDSVIESNETINLTLSSPSNATLGSPSSATLTITDNDTGGPPIGGPDGSITNLTPGSEVIIDLGGSAIVADGNTDFDLVYYESNTGSAIQMDWVIVQVSTTPGGPWYTILNWGNGGPDGNTSIGQLGYSVGEADNENIPQADLYNNSGIQIDVDGAGVPAGTYPYLRIYSPPGGDGDAAQIDSIQIF